MRLSRLFGWSLIALVAWFFGKAIAANWERVVAIDYSVTPTAALVVLLFVLAVVGSGVLWGRVFAEVAGLKVGRLDAVRCHLASWILKYIPGQVGGLIYKVRWADRRGAGKSIGALAYGYELLFLTLSSTLVVIPLLIFTAAETYIWQLLLGYLGLTLAMATLVQRAPFELTKRVIRRLGGSEPSDRAHLSLSRILVFTGWFLIPRFINAVAFVMLAESLVQVTPGQYVLLGAAYVLAGIVGIYAVFVPSGMGVREGVIVALVSTTLPLEQAIMLAVIARLYATVADGVLGVGFFLLTRWAGASQRIGARFL